MEKKNYSLNDILNAFSVIETTKQDLEKKDFILKKNEKIKDLKKSKVYILKKLVGKNGNIIKI